LHKTKWRSTVLERTVSEFSEILPLAAGHQTEKNKKQLLKTTKRHVNYTANSKEKMDGLNRMRLKRIAIKVFENCLKEKTDGLN